ncbi:hypothetical protein BWQ96_04986 [Gracilariopsis chorda]|uniref:Uncharacterized protein n=1 Tax=Gracilariopsis chorda TaxID=448386 RepID=A0A2V3IVR0_9FLOR|nr:hypothetical protein BWQ96_10484 [Gracilariopsis chorda]PXF45220.1 hypothetical protein BWQ96_04986 [Gracilariopsis chorda]|eukprot:PXF39804.1 hypothetical protein BWQ96_10484 [Gracilariopsis chorda]
MLLMLQKFGQTEDLELAMLLDERPFYNFQPILCGGEPWRANGCLVEAMRCADLHGWAWLFVVYKSDPASQWGRHRVKVVSGGIILRAKLGDGGIETGQFERLRYEVLARGVFHNAIGIDSISDHPLISLAAIRRDPRSAKDEPTAITQDKVASRRNQEQGGKEQERVYTHRVLGLPEPQIPSKPGRYDEPCLVPKLLYGVEISRTLPKGNADKIYFGDGSGRDKLPPEKLVERYETTYQFLLTEYQRRPYVAHIMTRLGFTEGNIPGIETACMPYLRQVIQAFDGLANVTDCEVFN